MHQVEMDHVGEKVGLDEYGVTVPLSVATLQHHTSPLSSPTKTLFSQQPKLSMVVLHLEAAACLVDGWYNESRLLLPN